MSLTEPAKPFTIHIAHCFRCFCTPISPSMCQALQSNRLMTLVPQLSNSYYMANFWSIYVNSRSLVHTARSHSRTTLTKFDSILTTYPLASGESIICGNFTYYLSFVHVDFLLTIYLPRFST